MVSNGAKSASGIGTVKLKSIIYFLSSFICVLGAQGLLASENLLLDRWAFSSITGHSALVDSPSIDRDGFLLSFGFEKRWRDRFVFESALEVASNRSRDSAGISRGSLVRICPQASIGLSQFIIQGKWGAQITTGSGLIFFKDTSLSGRNRKTPGLGLKAGGAVLWRPFFTTGLGYNSFIFSLRSDLWRYLFTKQKYQKWSVDMTVGFGVEF